MAKKSLSDLASAFASKTSGESNNSATWKLFFNFWKAPVDSVSTVRFLPDADEENPLSFLVENLTHELTVNGKREKVACLKMYGKECPICALSANYYDEKSADHDELLGKKYYRKKSYIGQVLVLETAIEHDQEQLVKLIEFGPQVFKQIQAAFQSGDLEEAPHELKGGYNFRFRKTLTGSGQNSYTTSNFAPKQTDVADDLLEAMTLFNLADYRAPEVSRDIVEAMLMADQTGANVNVGGPAPKTPKADAAPSEDAPAAPTAPAEGGEKKLSVVEQLKARAAAAKAAQAE